MNQPKVVEVDMRVRLALLLVHSVSAGHLILPQSVSTGRMCRLLLVDGVLLVDPESVDAVVERVLARVGPSLEVCQQAEVLGHGRHVDLVLEADHVVISEAFPLLDGFLDQVLALFHSVYLITTTHIVEGSFVGIEKHLILVKVDCLGRDGVLPDEGADHDTEAVLGSD